MIKEEQQAIDLARWTLNSYVKGLSNVSQPELTDPYFNEKAGVFVTLKKNGMLRGCIGVIVPVDILARNIITSTRNSALNDHRFPPVRREEVDEFNECYNAIKTIKNRNNFLVDLRDYLRKYDNKQEWTEKYLEVFNA